MDSRPKALDSDIGPAAHPIFLDAVLRPNRSLGRGGFAIFMTLLSLVSFAAGILFVRIGAWPVFGFFGLDVIIVYIAFRLNYRSGQLAERIRLDSRDLIIRRTMPKGAIHAWRFEPTWTRVELDSDARQLALRSHGQRLTLGQFLNESEKREIAQRLESALRLRATTMISRG